MISIVRLVYYTLVDNYMYERVRDRRYFRYGIRQVLQQMHLGEFDVVDSRINEQLDMSEELLGVISAPVDGTLSTSGMSW